MQRRLVEFPYVLVRVGCARCDRSGQYRLARLAERYGAEIGLTELLAELSVDCKLRKRHGQPGLERCGAVFLDIYQGPPPDEPNVPPVGPKRTRALKRST